MVAIHPDLAANHSDDPLVEARRLDGMERSEPKGRVEAIADSEGNRILAGAGIEGAIPVPPGYLRKDDYSDRLVA